MKEDEKQKQINKNKTLEKGYFSFS